ncbi:MAG TPA: DUF3596 domain-containing protein [Candidatus Acidoferrales bacterium]|nr:DUF3596 domain-containing protein [Candidatus Acidoferrales bacterium]
MSVRINRHGLLFLDFYYRGIRCRESTGLQDTPKNRKLALDWDATVRREIQIGIFQYNVHFPHSKKNSFFYSSKRTLAAFAQSWLDSHKGSWADWTYRKFRDDLEKRIIPRIGNLPLTEILPLHFRQLREDIIAQGKKDGTQFSNRTVNRILQPLKAIFNELFADGLIASNPANRLGKLKEKRIAFIDPFSDKEVRQFLKATPNHFRSYVRFLFESGFRPMEANGLKWSNVNFVTGILSVREGRVLGKDKDPKTERAVRDVEITTGMLKALADQKTISKFPDGYVFVSEKGQPLDISNFRQMIWTPALKRAGLKYRYPYQARHTFATKHLSQGYDPLWIANQMGTSLEMLFKHYAVYIPKKSWATVAQKTQLSTGKRT